MAANILLLSATRQIFPSVWYDVLKSPYYSAHMAETLKESVADRILTGNTPKRTGKT
jgi:hypothetical protein